MARKAHSGIWDVFDPLHRDVVTVSGGGVWPVANEANARLIAAAPDMLEALLVAETHLRPRSGRSRSAELHRVIVAAIAKATRASNSASPGLDGEEG